MVDVDVDVDVDVRWQTALVTSVSADALSATLRFESAVTAVVTSVDALVWRPGDVVLVDAVGNRVIDPPAPLGFQGIALLAGRVVVRKKTVTLVKVGGTVHSVPTSATVNYKQGHLVEFRPGVAVTRRVSKRSSIAAEVESELDAAGLGKHRAATSAGNAEGFDDFFGYAAVKDRVRQVVRSDAAYRERLEGLGERPIRGVLFTGDPGTGKTFMARIIAHETGAKFFPVSGPEITSQWVNRSEQNLRDLFADARSEDRAIIYFDEIDSIAGRRGRDTGNDTQKFVGQLLSEMDGFNQHGNVTVIAATNNADVLDPALRRPGRFDWEIFFPLPDRADREAILRGHGGSRPTDAGLPYEELADRTAGWSGARLRMIWTNAAQIIAEEERDTYTMEDIIEGFERVRELSWNGPEGGTA